MADLEPAYRGEDPYVFVSYSHADEKRVFAELRWLQDQGVRLWYDTTGISAGAEWSDEIASAIKGASCFLYFVTPRSAASEHCRRELTFSQSITQKILAVHLEETALPDGLRLSLENRQAILSHRMARADYEAALISALSAYAASERSGARVAPPRKTAPPAPLWVLLGILVLAVSASAWLWLAGESPSTAGAQSIAVLPFVDMSPARDQQHIGDGIAEEILDQLTGLEGLRVTARTSSFAFRDRNQTLPSIAEALNVNAILEGSIRRDGDRLRITAQLINASDGYHLWSETYERQLTDIFAIQADIARAVAGALGITLGVGDVNAFSGAGTNSVEAYETFLEARTRPRTERIRLLERAVALDPAYAAAWGELGRTVASTMWVSMPQEAPRILDEAAPHLARAVELDPQSSLAYSMLATVNYARLEWSASEEYFRTALSLSPGADALQNYGNMLMRSGRSRRAIEVYDSAARAEGSAQGDGFNPDQLAINAYLALERFDEVRTTVSAMPAGQRRPYEMLLVISEGNLSALEAAHARNPAPEGTLLATLMRESGNPADALALLETALVDTTAPWPSKYHDIALLAALLGDPELALRSISVEARLTTIRLGALWYPVMREVRKLPGFASLMNEINLTAYWRAYGWADHCRPTNGETIVCS